MDSSRKKTMSRAGAVTAVMHSLARRHAADICHLLANVSKHCQCDFHHIVVCLAGGKFVLCRAWPVFIFQKGSNSELHIYIMNAQKR